MNRTIIYFFGGVVVTFAGLALFPQTQTEIPTAGRDSSDRPTQTAATIAPTARVTEEHAPVPTPTRVAPSAQPKPAVELEKTELSLSDVAAMIAPRGREWEAVNGDEATRARASQILAKMDRLEAKLDKQKSNPHRALDLTVKLHERLAGTDSHVQDGVCGETICRVNVIHETDINALRFQPDILLGDAESDTVVDVMLDRDVGPDGDGQLKHLVYFSDGEGLPEKKQEALAELEKQRRILSDISE